MPHFFIQSHRILSHIDRVNDTRKSEKHHTTFRHCTIIKPKVVQPLKDGFCLWSAFSNHPWSTQPWLFSQETLGSPESLYHTFLVPRDQVYSALWSFSAVAACWGGLEIPWVAGVERGVRGGAVLLVLRLQIILFCSYRALSPWPHLSATQFIFTF